MPPKSSAKKHSLVSGLRVSQFKDTLSKRRKQFRRAEQKKTPGMLHPGFLEAFYQHHPTEVKTFSAYEMAELYEKENTKFEKDMYVRWSTYKPVDDGASSGPDLDASVVTTPDKSMGPNDSTPSKKKRHPLSARKKQGGAGGAGGADLVSPALTREKKNLREQLEKERKRLADRFQMGSADVDNPSDVTSPDVTSPDVPNPNFDIGDTKDDVSMSGAGGGDSGSDASGSVSGDDTGDALDQGCTPVQSAPGYSTQATPGAAAGVAAPTGQVPGSFGYNQYNAVPKFAEDVKSNQTFVGADGTIQSGDQIMDVETHTANEGSNLRPEFGMEAAANVIPSEETQIKSDLMFDMFDVVHEGFGNGEDNKLYLMEQNRDAKILFADPMFSPGASIGPEAGVGVTSWKLQRQIPTEKMAQFHQGENSRLASITELLRNPAATTNVLGDDVGFDRGVSSKGLKRSRHSVFAPIISNEMEFTRVKMPSGAELNGFGFRLQTDAMRYPQHLQSRTSGMGGPTLSKRRSLAINLQ
jgi:hypothetical protein